MNILITGAHGLVGSHLIKLLQGQGHKTARLVRTKPTADDIFWNPEEGTIEAEKLDGFDAVVHLAGDNIASGRWTERKKQSILSSRVKGTDLLCRTLAAVKQPPRVLVSGSAIGFYGDRQNEVLTEESGPGKGFLADVCQQWEAATKPAQDAGMRVVLLRTGVVLSTDGGALTKMLPPFQMGAGGKLGSGKQYMSWIALDDLAGVIAFALTHDQIAGPVNAVAPNAVTNNQFTAELGFALKKPTILPLPGFAAHLILGEMADELLLASALVRPTKLLQYGYEFKSPDLKTTLVNLLGAA